MYMAQGDRTHSRPQPYDSAAEPVHWIGPELALINEPLSA